MECTTKPNYPALQLAGLFGTTLAPIAGHFGIVFGVLAGFIHSALVLQTGGPVAGLNLYNNGFSGGLIAIVLYPTLTAIIRHRRPKLRDADYYDLFEADQPINMSYWHLKPPKPGEEHGSRMRDDVPDHEGRSGRRTLAAEQLPEKSFAVQTADTCPFERFVS